MSRRRTQRRCGPVQATPGRAWTARLLAVPEGLEPTVWMQGARTGQEGWEAKVAGSSPLVPVDIGFDENRLPGPVSSQQPGFCTKPLK